MLEPGPHTVGGILGATGQGATMGGTTGAGVGAVSSVGRDPCFPTDTPVLMADGTTRPIEDVAVGDHVTCTNPDTGQPTTSTVTRTFTHEHTPTIRIRTSNGDLETTPAHPLYVHGKGFTPAGHIQSGDHLRDNHGHSVTVHTVTATGQAPTVHNIEVNNTHTYHTTTTTGTHILAHNGCTTDFAEPVLAEQYVPRSNWSLMTQRNRLDMARDMRDQVALEAEPDHYATVTSGYTSRGHIAVAGNRSGVCAERNAQIQLDVPDYQMHFTEAVRPRLVQKVARGEPVPNGVNVDICHTCQHDFGRWQFPRGTKPKTGGEWGE